MGSILVKKLGKAYKQYGSRFDRLREWLSPTKRHFHQQKWILQDINFEVRAGEAVGIIGINGAGKSTLLKLITGTAQATTGEVIMHGRVAAMLELGMGFHPEFTGRQNVYMAGQLLGLDNAQINELMPDIEDFAEIGEYIDQPVRVYSSGMQVRLAFSVATAIRPDILIVDEALSVGDAYFQHKSFERIRDFRQAGTTLLLVSHDKQAIQSICDRAILLNRGRIAMQGDPEAVMDYYNALLAERQNQTVRQEVIADGKIQTISGSGEATVQDIAILDETGKTVEFIDVGQSITLQVLVAVHQNIDRLVLGYGIKDRLGQVMYGTNTALKEQVIESPKAGDTYRFEFRFQANLGPGSYSIQTALVSTDTHLVNNYEWRDLALVFNVININKTHFVGCSWMDPTIEITSQ
ncbi:ABC transporter ATP-binding protein [Pseudomonas sp. PDM23]|uniref:ABC transporter ATP-binding protein n=1 Tax=unclassified Pseudomonas TaxID=196821 RepID=UPI00177D0F85|nr:MULTISPECIES: ABC transporter ATP-binding protein [unclassified Pseudomonas]MBD9576653.1 ABC transporter ATP-binding protein [Pseudomonas sp. PDM23]MBD9670580.1 ABC transporter ATP-binding protein [Pseudomonas sp. PDM21]